MNIINRCENLSMRLKIMIIFFLLFTLIIGFLGLIQYPIYLIIKNTYTQYSDEIYKE